MSRKHYRKAKVDILKRNSFKEASLKFKLQASLLWFEFPKWKTEGSHAFICHNFSMIIKIYFCTEIIIESKSFSWYRSPAHLVPTAVTGVRLRREGRNTKSMDTQKMANTSIFSTRFASKNNIHWKGRMKVVSTGSQFYFILFVYNREVLFKRGDVKGKMW